MKRGKLLKTTFVTLMVCATAGTLFACGGDKEYKVVYLGGEGATGDAPAEATYKEGDKFNLATNTFTKANHTFKGWSDGTSTYLEGVEYTMGTADVTFTALWEENSAPITYTVTYALGDHAASDATVPSAVGDLLANAQVTLPAAPKAAEGYEFTGWKVGSDSTLKKAGDKITVTANVTVTAQWKAKEVTPPVDDKYATDAEIKDGILNWYTPNSKNYFVADGEEVTVQATYKLTEVQAWFGILTDIGFNGNFYRFRPDCQVFFPDNPDKVAHNTWTEDPALYNLEIDRTNWDEAKYKALFDNDGSAIQVIHITLKDKVLTVTLSYYAGTDTELKTPVAVAAYKATTESDTAEIQPYFYTDHAVVSTASAKYAKASNTFVNLTFDFDTEGVENAVVPMRPGKADYVFGVDPTKAGYTFGGWKSSDESDTTLYKNTDTVPVTAAVTYTAQWTVAKYTVTYVLGGNAAETATAPEAVSDKLYGDKINLPEAPAAAAGYEFDGWKVGDDTTLKAPAAEIEITGDVTITAVFKGKEEYRATYKPGDHAADPDASLGGITVFYDDAEITLPNAPDAATGYEFAGWKVGDATELKQTNDKITLTANTDIVAQWKAITYTVTFNVGDHAAEGEAEKEIYANKKADFNTEIDLPAGPTAATGYSFTGWKVGDDATLKQAGDKITVTADTTLTAQWVSTENSWTVTFLANEGDQTAHATQTVAKDATGAAKKLVLPTTNAPTKDGYRLLGWYLSTDDAKTVLTNETLPDVTANMTVIAKWQAVFTVTVLDDLEGEAVDGAKTSYDNNGADGTAEKFVAPTGVEKTGYTLAGWFEVVDNEGTKEYGSEVTATTDITKSMTVAAKWNEIKYTVTYALGEHAATTATAPEAVEVTHNVGKVTLPAAPAAETNYAFKGWKVGDATELSAAGAEVDVTADVTITAQFGLSIVIGAADFNKPWSGVAPEWTDTITPGTRITLTGTLTSRAVENYHSLTTNLFKGDIPDVFMRSDDFVANGSNAEQTQTADGDFNLVGRANHGALRGADGWTIFKGILATEGGCNVKVVFDWKEADVITITVIHSNNTTYHAQVYSWKAAADKTLADSYKIGIGNDSCYAVFDSYEKITYTTDKVTTAFEEPNKNLYEGVTGMNTALVQGGNLQLGQEIVISGKQASEGAENYHSLVFEFRNENGCYTGRSDSFGWTWTAEGKVCPFRDTQAARFFYIKKADGTYSSDWADFKDVAKDCTYIISATWINQGEIEIKLVMNGTNGNQFVCYYQLEVTDSSLQQISFTIGAETVTTLTAESKDVYTHITTTPAAE